MGIDLVWMDERGNDMERVEDPRALLSLLVDAARLREYVCLSVLDPYGLVVFNHKDFPLLLDELVEVRGAITDAQFQEFYERQRRRTRKAGWGTGLLRQQQESLEPGAVQAHLDKVIELVRRSLARPNTFLRFVGD